MSVHNMMEQLVHDCLKEYVARHPDIAPRLDERMKSDVMAITLNQLPPKYVASEKGEILTKTQLHIQHESDVFRELAHAIEKVLGVNNRKDFQ
jgi:competence protein ComFB